MQCPPDFVAVPAIVALGAVLGRKIGIRPQRKTDWIEVPNLWGCIVGRPGMMKSPAMSEALKPLHHLDGLAREQHAEALKAHARKLELHKLALDEAKAAARKALKAGSEPPSLGVESRRSRRRAATSSTIRPMKRSAKFSPTTRTACWAFETSSSPCSRRWTARNIAPRAAFSLPHGTGRPATRLTASCAARRI
jgi:putative DNA primase/helicase